MEETQKQRTRGRPERPGPRGGEKRPAKLVCPVCGAEPVQEKCKVVCRSRTCVYRIIYNCSEF